MKKSLCDFYYNCVDGGEEKVHMGTQETGMEEISTSMKPITLLVRGPDFI